MPGATLYKKVTRSTYCRLIIIGERSFHNFLSLEIFGDIYVSTYGGVLSLFVKLSRSKNIEFVKFHTYIWKKRSGKYGRMKTCAKKM